MAMNNRPPQPPPIRGLVGPGGAPLQMQSNWVCPKCKTRPPVTPDPNFPPGTPMAMHTVIPSEGETEPEYNCIVCWNVFYAKFVRRHAPRLVPVADGVLFPLPDDADPDEEVE